MRHFFKTQWPESFFRPELIFTSRDVSNTSCSILIIKLCNNKKTSLLSPINFQNYINCIKSMYICVIAF